jgi:trigger factor
MEEAAVNAATESAEVEISDGMIEVELDNMVQDMDRRLSYQGIKFEQYLKMVGKTMADFRSENKETAVKSIKMRLVLEAVYNDAKLEVSDEEIKNKVAELATAYGRKEEDLTANEELMSQIKNGIQTEKAVKYLVDNAKLVAKKAEAPKAEKAEKTEKKETTTKKTTTKKETK